MNWDFDKIAKEAVALGADYVKVVDVEQLVFSDEVRGYCEKNSCGKYGKNWACPPGVGPVSELKARALRFTKGIVVQTVHPIKNSFDLKGMMAAKHEHEKLLHSVFVMVREKYNPGDALLLGAGHCDLCESCTYPDNEPCRFPDQALASLEAYGMDVMKLTKDCGLSYRYGTDTVAYVGLVLVK